METQLIMEYDSMGDILYLGKRSPYQEQESEELEYGIIARLNPETGEIKNLEVLFFTSRLAAGKVFQLPILVELYLPEAVLEPELL